ncbi:MAG: hypothetical protein VKL59_09565 [Nostocaceae cyanobacterium]|nr:hypothetical protein [Nostocaceae cyanobacterium]
MPYLTQISITTIATVICTILATVQTGYGVTTFGNPDNYIFPPGQYIGGVGVGWFGVEEIKVNDEPP